MGCDSAFCLWRMPLPSSLAATRQAVKGAACIRRIGIEPNDSIYDDASVRQLSPPGVLGRQFRANRSPLDDLNLARRLCFCVWRMVHDFCLRRSSSSGNRQPCYTPVNIRHSTRYCSGRCAGICLGVQLLPNKLLVSVGGSRQPCSTASRSGCHRLAMHTTHGSACIVQRSLQDSCGCCVRLAMCRTCCRSFAAAAAL